MRLFSRKLAWLSTSKIKYPEIAEDLASCLEELVNAGLLSSGMNEDGDGGGGGGGDNVLEKPSLLGFYHNI